MDEDLNEDEVEERLYAMLHYAAEPQHDTQSSQEDLARAVAAAPTSTLRRYWRASEPTPAPAAPAAHLRVNKPPPITPHSPKKDNQNAHTTTPQNIKNDKNKTASITTPCTDNTNACKQETDNFDMDIFHMPILADLKMSVQIIESEPTPDNIVNLESSDEDEVVEVVLPPKPTITIESSDEEEAAAKVPKKNNDIKRNVEKQVDREISTSPVLSVVSSVSDDFIRGDCIALNISSKKPAYHVFDFSLHGSDLVETPAKKKKKKNKTNGTPLSTTQAASATPAKAAPSLDSCFATPKTKSKKKQKNKSFAVAELQVPQVDVYDSDSNHSIDISKTLTAFTVSDKSCPSTDVYESDSSQSEILRAIEPDLSASSNNSSTESVDKVVPPAADTPARPPKNPAWPHNTNSSKSFVDLTDDDNVDDEVAIEENIVMANVTGFQESDDYSDRKDEPTNNSQVGSTKVPKILFESLDFDFLKGKGNSRKRRFSITSLREEMDKFYNESWGGENFNHREIQKTMSRDKSLWAIDPKDRMPTPVNRKPTCGHCGRAGHRADACYQRPRACHMCGRRGHVATRCPARICVNCGEPNHIYTTRCRRCAGWGHLRCASCRRPGHPAPHCPDLWRRYHNTIDNNVPLAEAPLKAAGAQQCSACARRGHLAHACPRAPPYASLPLLHPHVSCYAPLYPPDAPAPAPPAPAPRKRPSGSPPRHDTAAKKRTSESDRRSEAVPTAPAAPTAPAPAPPREGRSKSADGDRANPHAKERRTSVHIPKDKDPPPPPPPPACNTDKNGLVIQDNLVSDSSDAVTTARVYLTDEARERLRAADGTRWLRARAAALAVAAELRDQDPFLHVTGTHNDQEAFQAELREWCSPTPAASTAPAPAPAAVDNIPKNRNNVLRQLSAALEALEAPLGEPAALYRELGYLRAHRDKLLKQKVVSPRQLAHNSGYIRAQLKRLNMVLLGQAGLGGGARHVAALRDHRARLHALRRQLLPAELRADIAHHYCRVFAATPRDDYDTLIHHYYARPHHAHPHAHAHAPAPRPANKKKKKKPANTNLEIHENIKGVPSPTAAATDGRDGGGGGSGACSSAPALLEQAVSCWRRLGAARGGGAGARRARVQLSRKLHVHITALRARDVPHVSSKQLKKIKKAVEQTHDYLKINNY